MVSRPTVCETGACGVLTRYTRQLAMRAIERVTAHSSLHNPDLGGVVTTA